MRNYIFRSNCMLIYSLTSTFAKKIQKTRLKREYKAQIMLRKSSLLVASYKLTGYFGWFPSPKVLIRIPLYSTNRWRKSFTGNDLHFSSSRITPGMMNKSTTAIPMPICRPDKVSSFLCSFKSVGKCLETFCRSKRMQKWSQQVEGELQLLQQITVQY